MQTVRQSARRSKADDPNTTMGSHSSVEKKTQLATHQHWRRKLAILRIQLRNGEPRAMAQTLAAALCTLIVLGALLCVPNRNHDTNTTTDDHRKNLIPMNAQNSQSESTSAVLAVLQSPCEQGINGLGVQKISDEALLHKMGFVSIGSKVSHSGLYSTLRKVETDINGGWNHSTPNVVPLGQLGYVKRDLPVYKLGFQHHDGGSISIAKRPADGMFSDAMLLNNDYSAIICLSFNTDMCFDAAHFPLIPRGKRVNRISALRDVIWSKDRFCRTMNVAISGIEDRAFTSFTFPCWVMPGDFDSLQKYSASTPTRHASKWIVKPRSLGAGMGIRIIETSQLGKERRSQNVIQTYMHNPHLVHKIGVDGAQGHFKWDLRSYVLVTSVAPIRAYVYNRGLVRFATTSYDANRDCAKNITACLTNTSLNKKVEGAKLKDITWSLHKLEKYFLDVNNNNNAEMGADEAGRVDSFEAVMLSVQRAIGLTLIAAESSFLRAFEAVHSGYKCENCYHLLGVDVIFDSDMQPKVVEVNGEPSLRMTSNGKTHYDVTKKSMAKDMLGIVYNKRSAATSEFIKRVVTWGQCATKAARKRNNAAASMPGTGQKIDGDGRVKGIKSAKVGRDHLEYLLSTFREHTNMGGFLPVYPNPKLASTYKTFLELLHKKESAAAVVRSQSGKPQRIASHADGRRLKLHELVTLLQDQEQPTDERTFSSRKERRAEEVRLSKSTATARVTSARRANRRIGGSADDSNGDDDDDDDDDDA